MNKNKTDSCCGDARNHSANQLMKLSTVSSFFFYFYDLCVCVWDRKALGAPVNHYTDSQIFVNTESSLAPRRD